MLATICRCIASSASSRLVQCVTGRPHSWGLFSQAMATIWQSCSAVKVGGAPQRGRSSSSSTIFSVQIDLLQSVPLAAHCSWAAAKRTRQRRARSRWHESCRAMAAFSSPSAAARITFARMTIACGQCLCRTRPSRISSCISVKTIVRARTPSMANSFRIIHDPAPLSASPAVKLQPWCSRLLTEYAERIWRNWHAYWQNQQRRQR